MNAEMKTREEAAAKEDIGLQQDVLDELDWEPGVDAANIGVIVENGVVTLKGHVPTYTEKLAAEQAALRVAGVRAVAEGIDVRLPSASQRTDAEVAEAVANAIQWHAHVPEGQVQITVENGWVTLRGEVESHHQRTATIGAVRPLVGVRGVYNMLVVKPEVLALNMTAAGVREAIQHALERTALTDAAGITVAVEGEVVTLSGQVRTWAEREDALRAAWSAPGVTDVVEHIEVEPYR